MAVPAVEKGGWYDLDKGGWVVEKVDGNEMSAREIDKVPDEELQQAMALIQKELARRAC